MVVSACGLQKVVRGRKTNESCILAALSHLPFEGKHYAFAYITSFFPQHSASHEKRNYAKIKVTEERNQRKMEIRKCMLKDWEARRKEKDSRRLSIH